MASGSRIISSDQLAAKFSALRQEGRCALIPYLTAGYPGPKDTLPLLRMLARVGADIIELGVPFSDPVADGPTIQRSSQIALENGTTLAWTLEQLKHFRAEHDTPVIIFSYLNPIMRYGVDRFVADAVSAGAQGVLITDLPAGGDVALEDAIAASPLALIRLVAPTTEAMRVREITGNAQGFIYYIARMGVTGARGDLPLELVDAVRALREVSPVAVVVGFGVSNAEQVRAISEVADGVVVGSALIDAIERGGVSGAENFFRSLRQ
jgi:tryptophan synthase alpha chain